MPVPHHRSASSPPAAAAGIVCMALSAWALLAFGSVPATAATLYVDNVNGSDAFDGRAPRPAGNHAGPTRTIRRALELARPGMIISIIDHGVPYHETLALVGRRMSGHGPSRFIIDGNGATLDGSRPVPPAAWRPLSERLWEVRLWRKGHVLLLRNGQPIPRANCPRSVPLQLLQLAAGRLCVHRGRILYGSEPVELPFEEPFRFGALDVAITLYAVENVEIRNLNIRHYRLDGIVAHDRCQRVRLVGVNAEANGRAGLTVGGTSHVAAASCRFRRNLEASVRIEEFGVFEADDCDLDSPPAILE